jgi:hypothetical protein
MRILIDADACPKVVKEIIYRAALRTNTPLIIIANRFFQIPTSPLIKFIVVPDGFDEADKRIIQELQTGDLVITADIPLADAVVSSGAIALNPRGTVYTKENIKHRLAVRNLMEQLRDNNIVSGGPASFSKIDTQALAKQLDKLLNIKNIYYFYSK